MATYTQASCQAAGGVWAKPPGLSFDCYQLFQSSAPNSTVTLIQSPVPSNDNLYAKINDLALTSVQVMAPVYLVVWACGIFRRAIIARL